MYYDGCAEHAPFAICKLCISHNSINQGALEHYTVSIVDLLSYTLLTSGDLSPTLVLKSPHTTARYCGGISSRTELTDYSA